MNWKLILLAIIGALMAMRLATPAYADSHWDMDDDPGLTIQIDAEVALIKAAYPDAHDVTVTSAPLPDGAYAATQGPRHTITFNETVMSDPIKLDNMMREDVDRGYHPKLGTCTPIQFLVWHEMAHVIDYNQGRKTAPTLIVLGATPENVAGQLSGYSFFPDGSIDFTEAIAESFAAVHCNGGTRVEQIFTEVLEAR